MMRFKEFRLEDAARKALLQEAVMGGSPRAQLATSRVVLKQDDSQLRQALRALGASTKGDDLEQEVDALRTAMKALVTTAMRGNHKLHLVLELLVPAHERDEQRTRKR